MTLEPTSREILFLYHFTQMGGAFRTSKASLANVSGVDPISVGSNFEIAKFLFAHSSTFEILSKTKILNFQILDH